MTKEINQKIITKEKYIPVDCQILYKKHEFTQTDIENIEVCKNCWKILLNNI